jgi:D-sedoheptulose 7-phosphate isomerase
LAQDIFKECFDAHRELLSATEQHCREPLGRLAAVIASCLAAGGKLLIFGNGGSAADAQHIAAELTIRFVRERRALPALALTTDSSALTACSNDLGFEQVFSRQIEALGCPGDVALGISTSGNSPNVVRALSCARSQGLKVAALAGRDGGRLRGIADPLVVVPAEETARIQEMHVLMGHILCADIEHRLGLV